MKKGSEIKKKTFSKALRATSRQIFIFFET